MNGARPLPPVSVCVNDREPFGIRLRSVTGIVLWTPKLGPELWFNTIAPDVSPGVLGVLTVSVTCLDWPGASVMLCGATCPKDAYCAAWAPQRTGPVDPPLLEVLLQM